MNTEIVRFRVAGDTHVGQVRSNNEDDFVVVADLETPADTTAVREDVPLSQAGAFFLVADGMGGGAAGEVASRLVIQTASEEVSKLRVGNEPDHEIASSLKRIIRLAHDRIVDYASRDINLMGMGTTATACLLYAGKLYVAWSGDSRLYRYNEAGVDRSKPYNLPSLEIVTREHSVVWEMVERGELTAEGARHHEKSHIITQNLGFAEDPPYPDTLVLPVLNGDRFLLCSDGLNSMVADNDIAAVLSGEADTTAAVNELIAAANAAGGHDNTTIVLVDVLSAPDTPAKVTAADSGVGDTLVIKTPVTPSSAPVAAVTPAVVESPKPVATNPVALPAPKQGKRKPLLYLLLLITGLGAGYFGYDQWQNSVVEDEQKLEQIADQRQRLLLALEQQLQRLPKLESSTDIGNRLNELKDDILAEEWTFFTRDSAKLFLLEQQIDRRWSIENKRLRANRPRPPVTPSAPRIPRNTPPERTPGEEIDLVPEGPAAASEYEEEQRPQTQPGRPQDTITNDKQVQQEGGGAQVQGQDQARPEESWETTIAVARMKVQEMVLVGRRKQSELDAYLKKVEAANGRLPEKVKQQITLMNRWGKDIDGIEVDLERAIKAGEIEGVKAITKRANDFINQTLSWETVKAGGG